MIFDIHSAARKYAIITYCISPTLVEMLLKTPLLRLYSKLYVTSIKIMSVRKHLLPYIYGRTL